MAWRIAARIIPARAGFTTAPAPPAPPPPDHPRSRGVYPTRLESRRRADGSSPLARGLLDQIISAGRARRIIPARAGFTVGGGAFPLPRGDHPRSRGVYPASPMRTGMTPGSSPLARGLLVLDHGQPGRGRIIPARAGFTTSKGTPRVSMRDHPRSRGVYPVSRTMAEGGSGSSPLARGLRRVAHPARKATGIIPARAGFTHLLCSCSHLLWDHPRSRGVYSIFPG